MRVVLLAWPLLTWCLLAGCAPGEERPHLPFTTAGETDAWLVRNERRYALSIAAAKRWLDALDVDPVELRAHGIKGKKKLVELLDAWHRLWRIAPDDRERRHVLRRVTTLAARTRGPDWHDLATLDAATLREDSTSYLRAAVILEQLGIDTTRYREEIRKAQPVLDAHLASRGAFQRATFHWYYDHFGLVEPFPLDAALDDGVIATRKDVATMSIDDAYRLTHEIFVPYEYGERLDAAPFDAATVAWLRTVVPALARRNRTLRNADLVAELVSCMRMSASSTRWSTAAGSGS